MKPTRMTSENDEDRRNDESHVNLVLFNIGAELNGVESWHHYDRCTVCEGIVKELDGTCEEKLKNSNHNERLLEVLTINMIEW